MWGFFPHLPGHSPSGRSVINSSLTSFLANSVGPTGWALKWLSPSYCWWQLAPSKWLPVFWASNQGSHTPLLGWGTARWKRRAWQALWDTLWTSMPSLEVWPSWWQIPWTPPLGFYGDFIHRHDWLHHWLSAQGFSLLSSLRIGWWH